MVNPKSFLFRSLYVFALMGAVAASSAWGQVAQFAPLNPAFEAWRDGRIPQAKADGRALGYIPVPLQPMPVTDEPAVGAKALPAAYDLRSLGDVTSVKNQSVCGACWTFATYASVESWLLRNLDETWDFSENHLKNYHGFDYEPCEGGNQQMSCAYLARGDGPVLEADDPYQPEAGRPSPGGPKQKQLQSMLRFPTAASIKEAVMTYGALATSLYWDDVYYNSSDHTYYCNGSIGSTDHGVAIVGWDDAKVVTGGPQPNPSGPGAWIIKNSWSPSWGESGYFYISYYDTDAVVASGGAYVFAPMAESTSYGRIYEHDELGMCGATGFNSDTPETCWGANVFTALANEDLAAVAFYTRGPDTTYTVYIYDTFAGMQFSDLLASQSGAFAEEGYHTVTLNTPVELRSGNPFAIVLRLTTNGTEYPMPVERLIAGYSSAAVTHEGESYISWDGDTWQSSAYSVCIKGLAAGTLSGIGSINVVDSILPADDFQMPFPTIGQGLLRKEHVTIQNTSLFSPLTVSTIGILAKAVNGAFSLANVPTLPAVVAPNGSLTIDVMFVPTGEGLFADTLLIESNDEGVPSISIDLSGEATPGGGLPAAGPAALAILAGAVAVAAAIKNRRRQ